MFKILGNAVLFRYYNNNNNSEKYNNMGVTEMLNKWM